MPRKRGGREGREEIVCICFESGLIFEVIMQRFLVGTIASAAVATTAVVAGAVAPFGLAAVAAAAVATTYRK